MKNENEAIGNLLSELEEAERVSVIPEEGTYSITYDYGSLYTLLCCNP
ncbi:hypothetical protein [Candidatus Merdisoma sp. JLR.KK006]|jgi:hypothetical protein